MDVFSSCQSRRVHARAPLDFMVLQIRQVDYLTAICWNNTETWKWGSWQISCCTAWIIWRQFHSQGQSPKNKLPPHLLGTKQPSGTPQALKLTSTLSVSPNTHKDEPLSAGKMCSGSSPHLLNILLLCIVHDIEPELLKWQIIHKDPQTQFSPSLVPPDRSPNKPALYCCQGKLICRANWPHAICP